MTVELAALEQGTGSPVVILHGLFGSARNWAGIAKALSDRHRVLALDLRNHGASPWADDVSYPALAEDVADFIERRGLGSATVIGHSMGGKTAMWLALTRPELVERLVAVDIAPVDYGHGQAFFAYARAMQAVDFSMVSRRAEVDAQLIHAVPDAGVRGFLLQNVVGDEGSFRWRVNLDALTAGMAAITGFPETAATYDGPALFLRGGRSDYVRPEHEPAIQRLFPTARIDTIDGCGHWPHAEQPAAFLDQLVRGAGL